MFTRHLVLLCAGGLLVPALAESASPGRVQVTARLYNTAHVPDIVRDAALRVATGALLPADIDVRWKNCDVAEFCATAPARGELVIRLVRSRADQIVAEMSRLVLGEAFIDMREGTGVLATVFVDRVELMAGLSETDATRLLGHAIAHEIGHLLLGTNAHSASGLMRAQWTSADIRRHASLDWVLTREDAAAIWRRLH